MAETYSRETLNKIDARGRSQLDRHTYCSNLERLRATVDYDGQAAADTIVLGELPIGAVFAFGVITAKATAGAAATIAIGTVGAVDKYRAAAVHTAVDVPTLFGKAAAAAADPLTAPERVIATIAVAALPTSADYLVIDLYYTSLAS